MRRWRATAAATETRAIRAMLADTRAREPKRTTIGQREGGHARGSQNDGESGDELRAKIPVSCEV